MPIKFGICLSVILSLSVLANENEEMNALLDEATTIATKTKLNIDYQPSVVSVLHSNTLKKIGIRNLHEAIGLLPGIETSILHIGWKQIIIRGAYNPDTFVFDKYKLYVDGVDVGSDLYSTSYYYLDFPIELIDRIEVLRGSASAVYGPGAFSGAINVITKSSQMSEADNVFGSIGSYDYTKAGFVKHIKTDSWNIGLDGYHQHSNKTLPAGPEFVSDQETVYSRTDYDSLENFEDYGFGITAKHDDFTLSARYKSEITDNFYGLSEDIEPVTGGYQRNRSGIIEVKNVFHIDQDRSLEVKAGLNFYDFTFNSTVLQDFCGGGLGCTFGLNPTYQQLDSYIDAGFRGTNITDHDWMAGVHIQKINTLKNIHGTTMRTQGDGGPEFGDYSVGDFPSEIVYLDGEYGYLAGDNDQWIKSAYAQDIYSLNPATDLSMNIRVDDYALFGTMTSFRMGGVYRLDDNNIFKAAYGRSFRAPSYTEAFQAVQDQFKNGNPNLIPESIDTYELAYTYKNPSTVLRTNLFFSKLQNVIDIDEGNGVDGDYANHKSRNARGIETELTHRFGNGSELMANISYVRTQYFTPNYLNPVEYQSPEVSEVLSKGYYLFPLNDQLSLNTAWYYSGPKKGYENVKPIDATMVIDGTLSYSFEPLSLLTFSFKNLFDEKIIYPSYRASHDGIVREGRNWLLTYEKQF